MIRTASLVLCLLSLGSAVSTSPAAAAVDPFYESLLREGMLAYERADYATAEERLRLACFGFLEDPALLTEGLARLALARARLGDDLAFEETFQRIVELDDRFGVYQSAGLPQDLRSSFEADVLRLIPAEYLRASDAFRHLVQQAAAEDLSGLPPKKRRRELEERTARDPGNYRWHLLLARTELELGRTTQAGSSASRALDLDPGNQDALCIRGLASAALDQCGPALADLQACRLIYADPDYAAPYLRCTLELGQTARAQGYVKGLPESVREDRAMRRLLRNVPPDAASPAATTPVDRVEATNSATDPPHSRNTNAPSITDLEALEQARRRLEGARSLRDLEEAAAIARPVANAYPSHRGAQHLVAEILFRSARYAEAVTYFERGGDPADDQPKLLFYLAVSYYETGRQQEAATILRRCLPSLKRSAYVQSYVDKILG